MDEKNLFLPISKAEMTQRGWDAVDIVLISGDAYVDHPAFGLAVIGRALENQGYRVGIIAMPDWKDPASIAVFGKPRLFFGVTSGNVDSMLARYTAFKRYRSDDPYVPGGKAGRKPERAVLVYCNLIKAAYKDVLLVIGGVEASMRRAAHYDFWSNKVRRSIIEDSRADILVYGMGEQAIVAIAERLQQRRTTPALQGESPAADLKDIPGTVLLARYCPPEAYRLPAEEEVLSSKETFVEFYREFYRHQHQVLAQPTGKRYLLHYPPANISTEALDAIYALPFLRKPHPSYTEAIPAFEMIRHSVTAHRGCVSGCSFCSLALHQGKRIVSRSPQSVLREVRTIAQEPDFKGHITDIGGPSANMYGLECQREWHCTRESCLFPALCPNLHLNTLRWVNLLQQAARIQGVSLVTVGSGLRYDLLLRDPEARKLLETLLVHHISGQLKIAPEHTDPQVLRAMRKIPLVELPEFLDLFHQIARQQRKKRYLLPYLMSCHPGSNQKNMRAMQQTIRTLFGFVPEQVQAFIPLPMTLSSVIYYTGIDPLTGEHFDVVRDMNERRKQHQTFTQSQD
ncbi:radical SAM domain protein [Candidatus Vecturithrix granuli]|uniref:Radical SAM domain protein n=1 Tax=Vecturithrix granuli TaxID=1499967 RepID=A0A081CA73_VECG1|nr:radical SAM domain protein [Candidatus Vecturithrix granuli]